jgi:hypothetical protein
MREVRNVTSSSRSISAYSALNGQVCFRGQADTRSTREVVPGLTDAVEKVGGESRWSLAVGWNWEVLGLIGVFCLAHAGLGLDADATN